MPHETKSFATWEDALRFCISEHEQGHVAEAEAGYAQLLHVQPDHVDGLRLRGLALTQLGKPLYCASSVGVFPALSLHLPPSRAGRTGLPHSKALIKL